MKGYAVYKRIKNDHLSVPVADSKTGAHLGLLKKVRLTVKLTRSDNFYDIVKEEESRFKAANQPSRRFNSPHRGSNLRGVDPQTNHDTSDNQSNMASSSAEQKQ